MTDIDDANAPQARLLPGARLEPSPRWVRVAFGGEIIADSRRALLLIQYGRGGLLPTYYFPRADVHQACLLESLQEGLVAEAAPGPVDYWTVQAGGRRATRAAWRFNELPAGLAALADHLSFRWSAMDHWYEEAEEIFVHARDPYKRVDALASTRRVQVQLDGVTVADTRRPVLLFETNLPTRYYLPREAVRQDLLRPSQGTTRCPYKGVASYWSVQVGQQLHHDLVWSYEEPIPECPKIKGLMCFFNEKVDLIVDGALQPRPATFWS